MRSKKNPNPMPIEPRETTIKINGVRNRSFCGYIHIECGVHTYMDGDIDIDTCTLALFSLN